jgi:hypothetical protein
MKFEEEDRFEFEETEGSESIFASEHDELLTQYADAVAECLRGNPGVQCVADEILDVISDFIDISGEIVSVSRSIYISARRAEEDDADLLDAVEELYVCSDSLLDLVTKSNDSSRDLIELVRELVGIGGSHG